LVIAGGAWIAFTLTRRARKGPRPNARLIGKALLWVAGIAGLAAIWKGDARCVDYDIDHLGGQCYEYEEGYEATLADRADTFAYFLTLFGIPVAIGLFGGRE
jgi:hypothetical protein